MGEEGTLVEGLPAACDLAPNVHDVGQILVVYRCEKDRFRGVEYHGLKMVQVGGSGGYIESQAHR